jgi:hypothetical protein
MPQPIILRKGHFSAFFLQARLYHGTSSDCADAILANGLRADQLDKQSRLSLDAVYLTTSLELATSSAKARAFRKNSAPVVIAVEAKQLNPDRIGFDLNLCGRYWSESIAYQENIAGDALSFCACATPEALDNYRLFLESPTGENTRDLVWDANWEKALSFVKPFLQRQATEQTLVC